VARRQLVAPDPPTAFLCLADSIAFGVYAAARDLQLVVPRDVSVIGYDDLPVASVVDPPLTTVRQPMRRVGEHAATLLLDRLEGERIPERTHLLRAQLVRRGSVRTLDG
jgi:LacI family xylobiose transport system transcriptional regulator